MNREELQEAKLIRERQHPSYPDIRQETEESKKRGLEERKAERQRLATLKRQNLEKGGKVQVAKQKPIWNEQEKKFVMPKAVAGEKAETTKTRIPTELSNQLIGFAKQDGLDVQDAVAIKMYTGVAVEALVILRNTPAPEESGEEQ